MTVINEMKVTDGGIASADEQGSTDVRKQDNYQKLHRINDNIIFGGSGAIYAIDEIRDELLEKVDEMNKNDDKISLDRIVQMAKELVAKQRFNLKNDALRTNIGIELDDLLTGTLGRANGRPLDPETKAHAKTILAQVESGREYSILLSGMENKGFKIYNLGSHGLSIPISKPYDSIGSGSDESDKVLGNYINRLKRKEREAIDPKEGLIKVIEATNASSKINVGVGGTPSIIFVQKDKIYEPGEDQCKLATEVVKGLSYEFLERDFAYELVYKLVTEDRMDLSAAESSMREKANDWEAFDKVLRGYKL